MQAAFVNIAEGRKQALAELKRENEILRKENQKLQKALSKKSLNIIKNL